MITLDEQIEFMLGEVRISDGFIFFPDGRSHSRTEICQAILSTIENVKLEQQTKVA